ncbi:MAG: SUMF1/EgtB/PvdO family nonheme iron enzyme [Saprospiraceae bacterium]
MRASNFYLCLLPLKEAAMEIPPLKVFIIYAHEDRDYKNDLLKSLKLLQKNGLVAAWHDRDLMAGDDWDKVIRGHLSSAHIIIPIISIDFFNSDYIDQVEIVEAFRRYESGETYILPIIVRPCKWMDDPRISKLQSLPEDGRPIAKWESRDDAFDSIYDGIKAKINEIQEETWPAARTLRLHKEDEAAFAAAHTRADFEDYLNNHTLHIEEARQKIAAFKRDEDKVTIERARARYLPEMVLIRGGVFQMGDTLREGNYKEKPIHSVTLSDFYLGKYAVTFAEFKLFIEDSHYQTVAEKEGWSFTWNKQKKEWQKAYAINWQHNVGSKLRTELEYNHPVIHVSWDDAQTYCQWLSAKTDLDFRLPTEAEWEFAAREGGHNHRFGNGKNVASPIEINFNAGGTLKQPYSLTGEYLEKTIAVNAFLPNVLGLHQMSGNVYEWCADWYGVYSSVAHKNPPGPVSGVNRVLRGGSWSSAPFNLRATCRDSMKPTSRDYVVGFRLARSV